MEIMIDIETLGVGTLPVVASIGAVEFDYRTGGLGEKFFARIDIEDAINLLGDLPLIEVMGMFSEWLLSKKKQPVWSNGSGFDLRILREVYTHLGMKCPWHYRDERDMRTFGAMLNWQKLPREGTHHNALDDAIFQARCMHTAYKAGLR